MVASIVGVLTALEQRTELDRLVGLVVMHGPDVQARQPQCESGGQRDRDDEDRACRAVARKGRGGPARHFGEP